MRKESEEFLKALIETPSPSGFERAAQEVWKNYVSEFAHEVSKDVHGNCTAVINPEGSPRLMLAGHIDEIGFMVTYIDDDGYIYFSAIGGHDPGLVSGQRLMVSGEKGPILGVVGKKAVHLLTPEERKKSLEIHQLWLDIGAGNRKEVEKNVSVGNPITYAVGYEKLLGDRAVSRAFDDKVGCFAIAEALRLASRRKLKAAVYAVSTVQEELGMRGARTSAFDIDPQVGVAVDVTFASDHPTMDKKRQGEVKVGAGPVISLGANINPVVGKMLLQAAKEKKLPYQVEGAPRATGTDANPMQLSRGGVATGLVSVPNRYMHTPVELVSLKDLENTARLLAEFICRVDDKIDFIP